MKRFTRRIMIRANEDHHKHQEEDNKEEGPGGGEGRRKSSLEEFNGKHGELERNMGNLKRMLGTWEELQGNRQAKIL